MLLAVIFSLFLVYLLFLYQKYNLKDGKCTSKNTKKHTINKYKTKIEKQDNNYKFEKIRVSNYSNKEKFLINKYQLILYQIEKINDDLDNGYKHLKSYLSRYIEIEKMFLELQSIQKQIPDIIELESYNSFINKIFDNIEELFEDKIEEIFKIKDDEILKAELKNYKKELIECKNTYPHYAEYPLNSFIEEIDEYLDNISSARQLQNYKWIDNKYLINKKTGEVVDEFYKNN